MFNIHNLFNISKNKKEDIFNLPGGPVEGSRRVVLTLSVALVVATGLAFYFWYQNGDGVVDQLSNQSQDEVQKLVAEISQFLILPTDEEPTVATVSDVEALKGQPFFAKAQKGDKVLIYTKAKKAILYNPATHKIVEVAPINLGNQPVLAPQP